MFAQDLGVRQFNQEPIAVGPALKLDPKLVKKISERVAIFSGMPQDKLLSTLAIGEVQPFKCGDALFHENDLGDSFYVVIVGAVDIQKMRDEKPVVMATLGLGECFGEMALVRDDVRSATVVAQADCVTICFRRDKIEANPVIATIIYKNIAAILARRLDDRTVKLADLVARNQTETNAAANPAN